MERISTLPQLIDSLFLNSQTNFEYGLVTRDHDPPNDDVELHTLRCKRGDVVTIRKHCGRYVECCHPKVDIQSVHLLHDNCIMTDLKFCISRQNTESDLENENLATRIGEIFVILESEVEGDPSSIRCLNRNLEEGLISKSIVRTRIDRCKFHMSVSSDERHIDQTILKGEEDEIVIIIEEVDGDFLRCVNKEGEHGLVGRENVKMAIKTRREKDKSMSRKIMQMRYPHLTKLPFRLVLSHILHFIPMGYYYDSRKPSEIPPFDYFGYFSLDTTKTPFFLFPYLSLDGECKAIIDYSRLKILRMSNMTPRQMKQIIFASPHMKGLHTLSLSCYVDEGDEEKDFAKTKYGDIFTKPTCFPNLKNLTVVIHSYVDNFEVDFDTSKWEEDSAKHIWENLNLFSVSGQSMASIVGILNRMANLKSLYIDCSYRGEDFPPNTILTGLKSLKKMRISGLKNRTRIECYETLESLISFECDIEIVKDLVMGSRRGLREIDISRSRFNENISYDWLVKEHRSSNYEKVHISNLSFQPSSFNRFSKNLSELYLSSCDGLRPHHFSEIIYPRLKFLTIYNLDSFENVDVRFPSSEYVESLTLDISELNESFFIINEWCSLKNLVMFDVKSKNMSGKNWRPMKKLNTVRFLRMGLENTAFETKNIFPNLERLSLDNMVNVTGVNWDPCMMSNLRFLEVVFCKKFDTSIFYEDNIFPFLEELCLKFFHFKKEGVIRGMKNLKKLSIAKSNISDLHFRESECFDNLEELVLEDCSNLKGEKWKFLKSLLEFKARKGVFLDLGFLKSPPFGEHVQFEMKEKCGDDFF